MNCNKVFMSQQKPVSPGKAEQILDKWEAEQRTTSEQTQNDEVSPTDAI